MWENPRSIDDVQIKTHIYTGFPATFGAAPAGGAAAEKAAHETKPLLGGASMKPWHGVLFLQFFRDIQQILQPSRHRVLNLVFVKTQSCLGPGQTWAPRQATPFVAVSAPVSAPMPRRRPNQDKNGIFHDKNLPYSNKINDSDQKNGAVASGHGFSTVCILQIAAKQEKNEPANSRFGFSFFIVAFFCRYFFWGRE